VTHHRGRPGRGRGQAAEAMSPGSYLVISHADVPPAHVVGTRRLSQAARELDEAHRGLASVPARTRGEIARFFGALTLVEPGLTGIWAWRPGGRYGRDHQRLHEDSRWRGPQGLTLGIRSGGGGPAGPVGAPRPPAARCARRPAASRASSAIRACWSSTVPAGVSAT